MNARDILHFGQQTLDRALQDLPLDAWDHIGVTTRWSPRDVLAHLASFERMLEDTLKTMAGEEPGPTLALFQKGGSFNDDQVAARAHLSAAEIRREQTDAHARVIALVERL